MEPKLFVLHAHFYQPPRENPWTGRVPREPGAAPFHDWNERIDDECYRPNAFGRVVDEARRISSVVNNYAHLSFNVGPTLVQWLREHDPLTLERMVEADRASARRHGGRGGAIANAWNHAILPLADPRDRLTQIRWGLTGFQNTFGRDAEAMWLPETAASHAVLDDLIDHQLRYVILAPDQAARVRPVGGGRWIDVRGGKVDPSLPCLYRHRDGSGRSIAVFFYDGGLAHGISFAGTLSTTDRFVASVREAAARGRGSLVHAADGETAGHHVAWGDRVLADALTRALPKAGFRVTHYGAALDVLEPELEVELDHGPLGEGSSWSCAHGVGRWMRDCGCRIQHQAGWDQRWRTGLRRALDLLRDESRPWFEREAGRIFQDPWAARDDYVRVLLDRSDEARAEFLQAHARDGADGKRGIALLELQHQLLLQYTSCGWFFDDIGGLEGRQVLRYAARAVQLWEELGGTPPLDGFLGRLAAARSNDVACGDGRRIFEGTRGGASADEGETSPPVPDIEAPATGRGAEGLQVWLDAQQKAGHDEDLIRRAIEQAVESAIEIPGDALGLIESAQDLDFALHLYRAQERWLVRAAESKPDPSMRQLGEALGFGPELVERALAGAPFAAAGWGDEGHG